MTGEIQEPRGQSQQKGLRRAMAAGYSLSSPFSLLSDGISRARFNKFTVTVTVTVTIKERTLTYTRAAFTSPSMYLIRARK